MKDEVIAFVEVKTRHSEYFPIAQTVTYTKQQRIVKAARHYILTHKFHNKVFRFDVATVLVKNNNPNVVYIPNAFLARY
jgi:putative endonuclease